MAASSFLNRAKMSVSGTPGTGTITLGSAVAGHATLAEAGAVDATKYTYLIQDGNDFEIGQGTYTSSGTTFSRDTVYLSKISGAAGTTKLTLTSNAIISIIAAIQDFGFFWENTNKRLGIGTNAPGTKLVAAANNTTPQAPQFSETIQAAGADGASMGILLDAYGGAGSNPQFVGRRAFGTAASPSAINAANTPLLQFGGCGYGATAYASSYRAMVQFRTAAAWTDTDQGAYVAIYTNPIGSAALAAERVRVHDSGGVSIGNTTDPGNKNLSLSGVVFRKAPTTLTADGSVAADDWTIINNKSGSALSLTLPTASSNTGRKIRVVNHQAQAVNSASSNVVPLAGGAAGTAIVTNTAGKWADLESDGTNWVITASN